MAKKSKNWADRGLTIQAPKAQVGMIYCASCVKKKRKILYANSQIMSTCPCLFQVTDLTYFTTQWRANVPVPSQTWHFLFWENVVENQHSIFFRFLYFCWFGMFLQEWQGRGLYFRCMVSRIEIWSLHVSPCTLCAGLMPNTLSFLQRNTVQRRQEWSCQNYFHFHLAVLRFLVEQETASGN